MKRGEIWTVAASQDYTSKLRPAVILRDDRFAALPWVTICLLTTNPVEAATVRIGVERDEANGLRVPCRLMVDKITAVPKSKLGRRIGRLSDEDLIRLNRAVVVFLGIATPSE